jgi:hypothetical protein
MPLLDFAALHPSYKQQIKRKQNAARRMPSDVPRHTGAARAERGALT